MFSFEISIDTVGLAFAMANDLDEDELFDFITTLDEMTADWDFTERLHKYFKDQHKILKAEKKAWLE